MKLHYLAMNVQHLEPDISIVIDKIVHSGVPKMDQYDFLIGADIRPAENVQLLCNIKALKTTL